MGGELVMVIGFWKREFLDGRMRINESMCVQCLVKCSKIPQMPPLQDTSNSGKGFPVK